MIIFVFYVFILMLIYVNKDYFIVLIKISLGN